MYRPEITILCLIVGLVLHELIHIVIAKYHGMISLKLFLAFPKFYLEMTYPNTRAVRGVASPTGPCTTRETNWGTLS